MELDMRYQFFKYDYFIFYFILFLSYGMDGLYLNMIHGFYINMYVIRRGARSIHFSMIHTQEYILLIFKLSLNNILLCHHISTGLMFYRDARCSSIHRTIRINSPGWGCSQSGLTNLLLAWQNRNILILMILTRKETVHGSQTVDEQIPPESTSKLRIITTPTLSIL